MVKKDKVLAFVCDESLEVRAHDAVPCGAVLDFELRLTLRASDGEGGGEGLVNHNETPTPKCVKKGVVLDN